MITTRGISITDVTTPQPCGIQHTLVKGAKFLGKGTAAVATGLTTLALSPVLLVGSITHSILDEYRDSEGSITSGGVVASIVFGPLIIGAFGILMAPEMAYKISQHTWHAIEGDTVMTHCVTRGRQGAPVEVNDFATFVKSISYNHELTFASAHNAQTNQEAEEIEHNTPVEEVTYAVPVEEIVHVLPYFEGSDALQEIGTEHIIGVATEIHDA